VAGHFVTLVALGLELGSYVQRTVAANQQFQTMTVSISILMAFYGLLLIALGVAISIAAEEDRPSAHTVPIPR